MNYTETITFRISQDIQDRLRTEAASRNLSMSEVIRQRLERPKDAMEHSELAQAYNHKYRKDSQSWQGS